MRHLSCLAVTLLLGAVLPCLHVWGAEVPVARELIKRVPEQVQKRWKDTTDPWGAAFSDLLVRYEKAFVEAGKPPFLVGAAGSMEKLFRVKYWFRGEFSPKAIHLAASRNECENFQVALLPAIGASVKGAKVELGPLKGPGEVPGESVSIYSIGYVETVPVAYPVAHVGEWPDPLFANAAQDAPAPNLAAWWIQVRVPGDAPAGDYEAVLTVSAQAPAHVVKVPVKLHVYDFSLPARVPFPVSVWTQWKYPWGKDMSEAEVRAHVESFLEHGLDPVRLGPTLGDASKPQSVSENMKHFISRGLQMTWVPKPTPELYQLARREKWLSRTFHYLRDEASRKQFETQVIPAHKEFKKKFPELRTMITAQDWGDMGRGCDIWVCDPSAYATPEDARKSAGSAEFWIYFCHLPIRVDLHRPLVWEPAVLIDTPSVEARTIFWMCYSLRVKGLMFWPGNHWDKPNSEDWPKTGWKVNRKPYPFPYAGLHNGNGYFIYPGPIPSIRMKVLRDGLEDYGYLKVLESRLSRVKDRTLCAKIQAALEPRPEIFVNTHYFNRDRNALLERRGEIAGLIELTK